MLAHPDGLLLGSTCEHSCLALNFSSRRAINVLACAIAEQITSALDSHHLCDVFDSAAAPLLLAR